MLNGYDQITLLWYWVIRIVVHSAINLHNVHINCHMQCAILIVCICFIYCGHCKPDALLTSREIDVTTNLHL